MIVFLLVQGFYVRNRPSSERPLVIVRDKVVLDASPLAIQRCVEVGMSLRQAKSIVFDGIFEEWNPDDHRVNQKNWLDVCCEFTDVVEPVEQHTAFVDLSAHPDPHDILERLIRRLVQITGCPIKCGQARTKWIAQVAIGKGDANFLEDLSTQELTPVKPEHRERLDRLGYRTVGQVAELPLKILQSQFGEDAPTIYQAVRGGCVEAVKALYPEQCIAERFVFKDPTDATESISNVLARLSERLSAKLCKNDLQGSDLRIFVVKEDAEDNVTLARHFAKPMQSRASVQFALNRMVDEYIQQTTLPPTDDGVEPLTNRWTCIRVQMLNLRHAVRKQANLYTCQATDQRNAAEIAVEQLHQTFGVDSVMVAANVIEPRHKRVLKVWKDALGWV
jgi:nucleotidyltransferase/DNA polymerase involved in DNA repair